MATMVEAEILFDFFYLFIFRLFYSSSIFLRSSIWFEMECHCYYHRYHLTDIIRRHSTQVFNDWNDAMYYMQLLKSMCGYTHSFH